MANQRDIKNRIKSIGNTKKITSTMEMVSTAKMKKLQTRLSMSMPYEKKVTEIIDNLVSSGVDINSNPLFEKRGSVTKVMIFAITGNRGLCGSYNSAVIENTLKMKTQLESEGKEVLVYLIGKKGISNFSYQKIEVFKSAPNLEDKITFEDSSRFVMELSGVFISKEVDEVYVSYTKVNSSTNQSVDITKLLPISIDRPKDDIDIEDKVVAKDSDFLFEPDRATVLTNLLPLYLKVRLFSSFMLSSIFVFAQNDRNSSKQF